MGFPGGFPSSADGKESAYNAGDQEGKIPGEKNGYPLQYSCQEIFHRQTMGLQRVGHG